MTYSCPNVLHYLELVAPVIPFPIYWTTTEPRVLGANAACLDAMGASRPDDVIGQTPYDYYPAGIAKSIVDHIHLVIKTGKTLTQEDVIQDISTGITRYYTAIRSPLVGENGEIVGVVGTSIEITAEKEAARLEIENKIKEVKLQEQGKLVNLARKVAHDMGSPLSTLSIISKVCNEIHPEKHRLLVSATGTIVDIANNLLSTYRKGENFQEGASKVHVVEELQQPLFLFDSITQLLSEKRVEYGGHPILLEATIDDPAQFVFALMQPVQLKRTLSNLINNAVDALENIPHGLVTVQLKADDHFITITVQDNGKGMPQTKIDDLLQRHSFTDKDNGHGLGWQQVWDTIDQNQGKIAIHSTPGKGTSIEMTFPRIAAPDWIAQAIHINQSDIIVIVDDDKSVQGAIALRFTPYLERHPKLRLHHFTQGQDTLDLLNGFTSEEKNRVMLLVDYDLLGQEKDGLDIIEASKIQRTTLITGYYTNPDVQNRIKKLGVKALPKHMAATTPVYMNE